MKSPTNLIRLARAVALAAIVAGVAVPAALAANHTRDGRAPDIRDAVAASSETLPDAVDRYLVAHRSETLPDAVDRYLVAHSSETLPDAVDRYLVAHRSETLPDAVDRYLVAHRSETLPDAVDRYLVAHPNGQTRAQAETTVSHFKSGLRRSATASQAGASNGFDWSDYGVGIGTGIGLVLLFAGGLAGARQVRHRAQAA